MPDRPDQNHYFGGGTGASLIHPVVLCALVLIILLVLLLPRKHLIGPVLMAFFLIPLGQQIYALGVHWFVARLIVLTGLARLASGEKGAFFSGGFNNIDKAFLGAVLCQAIAFPLVYRDVQALTNQFGFLIDYLGAYVLMRGLIQDDTVVYRALKWLAFFALINGFAMVREQQTMRNLFGLLGGVDLIPAVREGKIRSQGVFQHSLSAGTFAATLVPLFLLLWRCGKAKIHAALGIVGCTIMTICSNSSTPLLAYVAGLFAICIWPIRSRMRMLRWGLVVTLVSLHLVMKSPVWFLLAKIDLTGGSSGYHRAELVDLCIRHFWDWWLIGTKDAGTWAWDMWDAQNQYVLVAETGGLAALTFMILMIKRLYASLGNALKLVRDSKRQQWALWLLGSALFAHLTAFFGINLFDQGRVSWFMLLAAISAFTYPILEGKFRPEGARVAPDSSSEWCLENDLSSVDLLHSSKPGRSFLEENVYQRDARDDV